MTGQNAVAALFPWIPLWLIVTGFIAVAVAAALIAHMVLFAILRRFFGRKHPMLHAVLLRSLGITRYGFIVVSLSAAVVAAPLTPTVADHAHRVLLAAFIVFLGWLAIVGVNLTLDRYTHRFRLDVTDNLLARKAVTQVSVFKRLADGALIVLTIGFALMSFDSVRQLGVSLFASAGVAGIAAGLAARPVLGNLVAGMQIAITQPIRLGDVLVLESQWGTVEEITSTYVVMKLWDWRRFVVPLSYFFDKPFENWTRASSDLIGSVFLYVDYSVPVDRVRTRLGEIVHQSKLWDGKVVNLQVSDARENTVELRALVSARDSSIAWDLRCEVREKLIAFIQAEFPGALPQRRGHFSLVEPREGAVPPPVRQRAGA